MSTGPMSEPVLELIRPGWSVPDNVVAVVSTRSGGSSSGNYSSLNLGLHVADDADCVAENRRRLLARLDPGLRIQWLDQVHGSRIVQAGAGEPVAQADGAVSRKPLYACCVATADCLPVFFASRQGDAVALAHAGWRGLAAGVLENCVAAMDTAPSDLCAWLGPAIGPCHFEVGSEVREEFLRQSPASSQQAVEACFLPISTAGKYMADLYGLARVRLQAVGVSEIGASPLCTYCDSDRFFSFRRQPVTGRMLSLIYLKSPT